VINGAIKAVRENPGFWNKMDHTNEEQVNFANEVFNNCDAITRPTFLPFDNASFIRLASDPSMTPLITATLEAYESTVVRGSGNPKKAADYADIVAKYEEAKLIEKNQGPFTEQLTPGQERLIRKFEGMVKKPIETHLPNENAVTYCYLLGKIVYLLELDGEKAKSVKSIVMKVLNIFELHGDKTMASFNKVLTKYDTMEQGGVDVKPYVLKLINHTEFVTATEASPNNRLLKNNKLSLKRVHRMSYIYTQSSDTPWSLLNMTGKEFSDNLLKLYAAEVAANVPDKKSLSIIWYMCIGRKHMNCVMVDHHELSAANVLSRILGKTQQSTIPAADHAFDFTRSLITIAE
jgi:hypothetical protein